MKPEKKPSPGKPWPFESIITDLSERKILYLLSQLYHRVLWPLLKYLPHRFVRCTLFLIFNHEMNTFNFYFFRVKKAKPVRRVNHLKVPSSLVTPLRNVLCELLARFVTMSPKKPCNSAMEVHGCHW